MTALKRFLSELRRRKVLRVGVMYLIVAWGLIEAASVVAPEVGLPEWTVRAMIFTSLSAFPVIIVLTWIFDITAKGIHRTPPLTVPSPVEKSGDYDGQHSLAVLPFVNIGGEAQDEYFCDGLAEDLLNRLSRVDGLHVVARSSAFSFRDRGVDVREVAQSLGVTHVLEGSVRRAGNQLRVAVRLVQAQDAFQLWSETYDREMGDTFRIQDEISNSVFEAFNYQFAQPDVMTQEQATDDIEAYHLYLMGRHQFHKRTPETLNRAMEYFEQAIALDPQFALPLTGLADAYALSSSSGEGYGNLPVVEALALAEPLVRKALELDPQLAEAHASSGLLCRLRGDMPGAETALRQALELNDRYPLARTWLALTLTDVGRVRDANAEYRKALEADPLSSIVRTNLGYDRLKFGQPEEARRLFKHVIDLDPVFPPSYLGMAAVERRTGHHDEAEAWLQKATALSPRRAYYRAVLGLYRVETGRLELAARDIARAAAIAPDEPLVARARMALLVSTDAVSGLVDYTQERLRASTTPESRANAALAALLNGDPQMARELYEQVGPELHEYLCQAVVWSWRFPHGLLYAYALQQTGAEVEAQTLVANALEQLQRLRNEGIVNPEIDYLEAAVAGLQKRPQDAQAALARALQGGWYHGWWALRDPMLAGAARESLLVRQAVPPV